MNSRSFSLMSLFLLSLLVMSLSYNSDMSLLHMVGSISIVACVAFGLFMMKRIQINKSVMIPMVLTFVYFIFLYGRNPSIHALRSLLLLLITIIVILTFSQWDFRGLSMKRITIALTLQISIVFLPFLFRKGFSPIDNGYMSLFSNTTYLGYLGLLLLEICFLLYVLNGKKGICYLLIIGACILMIVLSKGRTALLGALLLLFTVVIEKIGANRSRRFYKIFSICWILVIVLGMVGYVSLFDSKYANTLSTVFIKYTGKPFFSGRQVIWTEAFRTIKKSAFFGYGLDYSYTQYNIGTGNSIHNTYLDLMMCGGIVLVVLITWLIISILDIVIKKWSLKNYYLYAFSLINLFMCVSEVILLRGQVVLQILMWIIMVIGTNDSICEIGRSKVSGEKYGSFFISY